MTPMARLRTAARSAGLRTALKRSAEALGFDLVKRSFYSPIPDWRSLPESTWAQRSPLRGVAFDLDAQMAFLERDLAPYLGEFAPPRTAPGGPVAYHYENGFFTGVDADVLYAMVRHAVPRRVLELGSGFSTLVIGQAAARNAADGRPVRHDVYDPFSRPDLRAAITAVADLHLVSATDVPLAEFAALEAGDVLFVDTTHTVKLASDVNFVILEVLPLLRPGVIVHFHDIFLPYEYPKEWFTDPEVYWAEQYLLQAFLACNDEFEVLLGVAAALRDHPDRVRALIAGVASARHPGSFWMRRSGAAATSSSALS
jgi:hypothetical protein